MILRECRSADVVHVRCPAGVSLVALALLPLVPRGARRWIKYAGNWRPDGRDPWTYRIQRRWLDSGRLRGLVTVNGEWPGQPPHVRSFYNPCLTEEELGQGRAVGERKTLSAPVRILFVGSLAPSKGATRALAVLEGLARRSVDAALDIAGGGPDQASLASRIEEAGLSDRVRIHGWMSRDALAPLFGRAHFVLSPSETEGWPKVLSEGMAYGAVPVSSGVSCIPQYLGRFRTGRTRAAHDVEGFAEAIAWYAGHPSDWKAESLLALEAARHFSYSRYLDAVRSLLELPAEGTGEAP